MNAITMLLFKKLVANVDSDTVKRMLDAMLDIVEDACAKSETDLDNKFVLPLCKAFRIAMDIPEFDEKPNVVE